MSRIVPLTLLLTALVAAAPASAQTGQLAGPHNPAGAVERPAKRKIGYYIEWAIYARNYHPLDIRGGMPATNNGLFQPGTHVPAGTWDDWSSGATGVNEFWEIQTFENGSAYTKHWDSFSKVPFLYSPSIEGGHFIGYDDAHSMGLKVDYVNRGGFGGMMFWEFSADRNETLIDVIDQGLAR